MKVYKAQIALRTLEGVGGMRFSIEFPCPDIVSALDYAYTRAQTYEQMVYGSKPRATFEVLSVGLKLTQHNTK